jgi:Kef-type K+ transport system membrane component KefB
VLTDAGQSEGEFGQLVLAGATIADLGSVILLSLFFSGKVASAGAEAGPGGQFLALAAAIGLAVAGAG